MINFVDCLFDLLLDTLKKFINIVLSLKVDINKNVNMMILTQKNIKASHFKKIVHIIMLYHLKNRKNNL